MWGRTSRTQEIDTAHVMNPVAGTLLAVGGARRAHVGLGVGGTISYLGLGG